MRIKTVTIFGFGKWHDQVIDLATDYQVLFGQNEAGKSTLTALIKGILFGFASGKQRYEQYKPKNGAQYGGELLVQYQERELVIRRIDGKFGGDVTVIDQGNEFGADYLATLLAPADEALFTQIFETNQQDLNQIFGLKQADFLQHLLTIGAVGSHEWLNFAKALDKEGQKIYKPSGRKWPLNQALKSYPDLVQTVKEASTGYQAYEQNAQILQQATAKRQSLTAQIEQLQATINQQQRLIERWPHYQEWQGLQSELAQATVFDATIYTQYQALVEQQRAVETELKNAQATIAEVQETLDQTGEFRFYQANQATVTPLFDQLSAQQQQLEVLKLKQAQLTKLTTEKTQLVAQHQWGAQVPAILTADQVEQLQEASDQQQRLATEQQVLLSKTEGLQTQVATQEQLVNQLEATTVRSTTQNQTIFWGVGGILLLTIFLPGVFKVGAIVGLLVLGYGWYQRQQVQQQLTQGVEQKAQWQQALAQLDALKDEQQTQAAALTASQAQLQASQQQTTAILTEAGYATETSVSVVLNQQNDLKRVAQLTTEIKQQTVAVETLQNQLTTYYQQWQFAQEWVGALQGSDAVNLTQIDQFKSRVAQLQQSLAQSNESYHYYQQQVTRLTAKQTTLLEAQKQLLASAQLKTAAELEACYKAEKQRQVAQQRCSDLAAELDQALPELQAVTDLAQLENDYKQQQAQLVIANQALQEQQQVIAELSVTQQKLVDDDQYQLLRQEQLQAEANITDLAQAWLANQLAIDWIQATLKAASQERFPRILVKATTYFALLTQNRYQQINFEEEVMTVLRADQVLFEVGELSQGTAEQLYIALRFAFAEEIADVVSLPLLIDDGFVNFDDQRQAAIWELLQRLSEHHQVIYLTANPRTETVFGAAHWLNLEKVGQIDAH